MFSRNAPIPHRCSLKRQRQAVSRSSSPSNHVHCRQKRWTETVRRLALRTNSITRHTSLAKAAEEKRTHDQFAVNPERLPMITSDPEPWGEEPRRPLGAHPGMLMLSAAREKADPSPQKQSFPALRAVSTTSEPSRSTIVVANKSQ